MYSDCRPQHKPNQFVQIAPIQNTVYLTSMAIIAGARTFHQIRATVRAGFMPVMKVSWITSPIALAFAQKFLPEQTWVPFFNIISFVIGTYINAHTKKKRLAALRKKVCIICDGGGILLTASSIMMENVQRITQDQTIRILESEKRSEYIPAYSFGYLSRQVMGNLYMAAPAVRLGIMLLCCNISTRSG